MSQKNKAKRLNPAYLEEVFRHVNTCPYFQLLSIEIRALDWGRSHLQARVQEKHLQPTWTQVEGEAGLTTVELKLNYLAPVSAGLLIARGRSIKTGRTLCLSEASVENEKGALIAHGTSTLMVLESLRIGGQSHQVPKYLDIEAP
ncbi:MAG: PaaI family thioesterase [Deltaproteobacteria bacterium]|nr:PaaI family thioesterase [Deltaproteobacteria bacterium]